MNEVIQEGRNKEEALKAALEKLGVTREDVDVEVLETHREGLFGFIGSRPVKIRVFLKQHDDSNFNRIEEDFED
ncbi:MAG TPA: Jag N-terminal domain-containing protein, partial [bacterium]|nr:Jag N-terminal domain-containing protein [bacterium]